MKVKNEVLGKKEGKLLQSKDRKIEEKLMLIFKALDSNKDGFISSSKITLSRTLLELLLELPSELLLVFAPLINDVKKKGLILSSFDFIELATGKYSALIKLNKNKILKYKGNQLLYT
jgi:hypothetical protein